MRVGPLEPLAFNNIYVFPEFWGISGAANNLENNTGGITLGTKALQTGGYILLPFIFCFQISFSSCLSTFY